MPQGPPENISLEVIQLIRSEVGDHIYFQHKKEKNFVAESEVNSLREHFKELFNENSLSYLSHPDFHKRFLALKLVEVPIRCTWEAIISRRFLISFEVQIS